MEEERRLFYVALTRSSQHLYVHAVKSQPLSQFLSEASWQRVLPAIETVSMLLQRDPETWQAADARELARCVDRYHLGRYF
jgi:DNA helicase-2/ATP-dependent DNA helicase PcrA